MLPVRGGRDDAYIRFDVAKLRFHQKVTELIESGNLLGGFCHCPDMLQTAIIRLLRNFARPIRRATEIGVVEQYDHVVSSYVHI